MHTCPLALSFQNKCPGQHPKHRGLERRLVQSDLGSYVHITPCEAILLLPDRTKRGKTTGRAQCEIRKWPCMFRFSVMFISTISEGHILTQNTSQNARLQALQKSYWKVMQAGLASITNTRGQEPLVRQVHAGYSDESIRGAWYILHAHLQYYAKHAVCTY